MNQKSVLDKAKSAEGLGPAMDVAQAFVEIVQSRERYLKHRESEITRRIEIKSKAEVEIVAIREQAQLIRDYFIMEFAERRHNFDQFLEVLNDGIDNKNDLQVNAALSMITTLMQESPMKHATLLLEKAKDRKHGEIMDI